MIKVDEPVSYVMSKNLYALNSSDSLYKAKLMFIEYKVRHLPVVEQGRVVGILSWSDLFRNKLVDRSFVDSKKVVEEELIEYRVEQVMTKNPRVLTPDLPLKEALKLLSKEHFHAYPIVEDNKLVGMLTTSDVINYLLEEYEEEV